MSNSLTDSRCVNSAVFVFAHRDRFCELFQCWACAICIAWLFSRHS